ncbi:MAG: ATP-binding protein [Deltaproteobacteria bacterium]|nr:ATP-binding protein [Deltaproteobacteria bacterium]
MIFRDAAGKRWLFIVTLSTSTVLFHYIYGMSHVAVLEVLHRRLCYIPIVLGGLWFGVYGGVWTAAGISLSVVPFIYLHREMAHGFASGELVEIMFYVFIGWLTGTLSDAQREERKKNDALKEQLRTSERLSTIGELFAYMMHEIKNPLSSIKGAADIVADQSVDQGRKIEFADLLKGEIGRLDRTLGSMLAYTSVRLDLRECDIMDELGGIVSLINTRAEKGNVEIHLSSREEMHAVADCDKMRQVFINIILNAVEAMDGGGRLDITARRAGNNHIDILFKDTGPGIPPQHMDNLFKPFFTTKKDGSGLGLAISKRIVEEHGGRLLVQSGPGKGTVFTVRLPCSR